MFWLKSAEVDHASQRLVSLVARVPADRAVITTALASSDEAIFEHPNHGPAERVRGAVPAEFSHCWWLWCGYLAAITVAELTVALWSPELGMLLHLAVLFALPIHATFAPARQQSLLLALLFAPLVRVVSLALPLSGLSIQFWWLLTSVPLFVSAMAAIRLLGFTRQQLGLQIDQLPRQVAIALIGIPLAITEYYILHPSPIVGELSWETLLVPMLVLVVSTGFLEELLFRGILQAAAGPLLGRWGLVYISLLFAALHIGYQSVVDVVFVFAVGLGFAWIVAQTGSLLGVTLAHGLTNIGLFVILPLLAAQGLVPLVEPRDSRVPLVETGAPLEQAGQITVSLVEPSVLSASRVTDGSEPATSVTSESHSVPAVSVPAPTAVSHPPEAAASQSSLVNAPPDGAVAATVVAPLSSVPSASPTVPVSAAREHYVVQPGDSLLRIAALRGTTVAALVVLNDISDQNLVLAGQSLIVSDRETRHWVVYTVQPGDTVASIAQRTDTTVESLTKANRLDDSELIYVGQQLLVPRR